MLYPRVSLYALMLAAAGMPLYIHLPRYAATDLGISLATLGTVLLVIRIVDLVQDPVIGWLVDRWPRAQPAFALAAAAGLAIGFPLLFALSPGPHVVAELVLVLLLLFTAYSLGSILLYGRSATLAESPEPHALLTLATWREAGTLTGVILAAIAPTVLVALGAAGQGYRDYGLFLGALSAAVALVTLPIWRRKAVLGDRLDLSGLRQAGALRLLLLAFVNGLPVAMTSTLFLFFVEDRLALAGQAGPLLILFFAGAGVSVPLWSAIARRIGAKATLLAAMPLSILGFVGAGFLEPGNLAAFALICLASGAALGADMVILPAMFSVVLTRAGLKASLAFGIWSFAAKFGLALAAFLVLPVLDAAGFVPGTENSPEALGMLTLTYAVIPCLLKILALAMVLTLPSEETPT